MTRKAIGKRIQKCRKAKGFTQDELSERVGISTHYLSALERGVYNIKLDLLVEILNVLSCSADEVFCDVVDKSSACVANALSEKLSALPVSDQRKILDVVDTMIKGVEN